MLITDISEYKKNKYKIDVDYEFAFVLYRGELHKYNLKKDQPITEDIYQFFTEQMLPKRAKLRAMNLLTKRPYTEAGLREKLREGLYPDNCIEEALSYVKSFGYVDDKAYATDYITYHMESQSRKSIEQKLIRKGIDPKIIQECMDECGDTMLVRAEQEQIQALFYKKYKGLIPEEAADRMKMFQFFTRKGYSPKSVRAVLGELALDDLYN